NYQNPEFDKLFEQMKFLEDGPEKQKLIDRMIELLQQDAVWSFGYFPTSAAAYHQWVTNGKPTQIIRNHIGYLRLRPPRCRPVPPGGHHRQAHADHPQPHRLSAARPGTAHAQAGRMEPARLV